MTGSPDSLSDLKRQLRELQQEDEDAAEEEDDGQDDGHEELESEYEDEFEPTDDDNEHDEHEDDAHEHDHEDDIADGVPDDGATDDGATDDAFMPDRYTTVEGGPRTSLEELQQYILKTTSHNFSKRPPLNALHKHAVEIVAVVTSLGGAVHQFFPSCRMIHFLNCKRVPWIVIDTNTDATKCRNLKNPELLQNWQEQNLLRTTEDGKLLVPQCLIDGISVGNDIDLMALEQDGDLDHIIEEAMCPRCLGPRTSNACEFCGARFQTLIAADVARENGVIHVFAGEECNVDAE